MPHKLNETVRVIFTAFWLLFAAVGVYGAETPLAINDAFRLSVDRAGSGGIHLRWQMPPGYYLYRQYLSAKTGDGTPLELKTFPGVEKVDPNFGKSEVYFNSAEAELGIVNSPVELTYQGCQEHGLCYPPAKRTIDPVSLKISEQPVFTFPKGGQSAWSDAEASVTRQTDVISAAEAPTQANSSTNMVDRFLARGGVSLLLAAFFGFGILLAFTPCVFPLYPILAATLAREGERLTARRGFILAISYAVGLAAAFGIFGAVAGWTGENLQIALQSQWTVAAVAVIFALLALSMFGLYELQLPTALVTRLSRNRGGRSGSITSAAVLGFSSAFIIGPCVTAPLAGALLYVARTGDIGLGATLLFVLGLGKGVPLVVFGTAGSQVLPRAGAWMNSVKHIFGFVFFAFGIWMAEPVVPAWSPLVLWAVWAMAVAVFLGAFDIAKGRSSPLRMASQAVGLLSAVYAVVLTVGLAAGSIDPLRPLEGFGGGGQVARRVDLKETMAAIGSKTDLTQRLDLARSSGKPSLIYFTADWCVSCRSIDRSILSRTDVAEALSPLQTLKVDLSSITPAQRELMRDLDVVGPPTMVFFQADRQEAADDRLIGEFGADDLLKAIAAAKVGS
jgi:thiol:disulfide interchange protein DsbD